MQWLWLYFKLTSFLDLSYFIHYYAFLQMCVLSMCPPLHLPFAHVSGPVKLAIYHCVCVRERPIFLLPKPKTTEQSQLTNLPLYCSHKNSYLDIFSRNVILCVQYKLVNFCLICSITLINDNSTNNFWYYQ